MDAFIEKFGEASSSSPTGYILPSSHASLIVSILSAGTFFGALSAGYFNESLGRRFSIIVACGVFCLGVILQTAAINLAMLVIGRFIAGLGMGVVSSTVILYMSELAPKKIRGAIVSGYQFAITIGLLLAAVTTNYTSTRTGASAYRIPIAVQFIPATLLVSNSLSSPNYQDIYHYLHRLSVSSSFPNHLGISSRWGGDRKLSTHLYAFVGNLPIQSTSRPKSQRFKPTMSTRCPSDRLDGSTASKEV